MFFFFVFGTFDSSGLSIDISQTTVSHTALRYPRGFWWTDHQGWLEWIPYHILYVCVLWSLRLAQSATWKWRSWNPELGLHWGWWWDLDKAQLWWKRKPSHMWVTTNNSYHKQICLDIYQDRMIQYWRFCNLCSVCLINWFFLDYWPENNLTGFRDPFVFESDEFSAFYANKSIEHKIPNNSTTEVPKGSKFLTISGGIRADANPAEAGPRLFLYRQKEDHNVLDWTYLGSLISLPSTLEKSAWGGSTGTSFECGSMVALNEHGRQVQAINGTNPKPEEDHKLNILFAGTEGARNHTHLNYWPIWNAISYDYNHPDGNVKANIDFSGVIDWGRSYAYLPFEAADNRQIMVGWCYVSVVLLFDWSDSAQAEKIRMGGCLFGWL